MLTDSVYYGYYGNNDWRDYVEHSIGCWKNKAVKYIDKVVGPGGKVRYIYDKKWGTNKSKKDYATSYANRPIARKKTVGTGNGVKRRNKPDPLRTLHIGRAASVRQTPFPSDYDEYGRGRIDDDYNVSYAQASQASRRTRKLFKEGQDILKRQKKGSLASVKKRRLTGELGATNAWKKYFGTIGKKPRSVKYAESLAKG